MAQVEGLLYGQTYNSTIQGIQKQCRYVYTFAQIVGISILTNSQTTTFFTISYCLLVNCMNLFASLSDFLNWLIVCLNGASFSLNTERSCSNVVEVIMMTRKYTYATYSIFPIISPGTYFWSKGLLAKFFLGGEGGGGGVIHGQIFAFWKHYFLFKQL